MTYPAMTTPGEVAYNHWRQSLIEAGAKRYEEWEHLNSTTRDAWEAAAEAIKHRPRREHRMTHEPSVYDNGPNANPRYTVDWQGQTPHPHDTVLMHVELFDKCIAILNGQETP